MINSCANCNRIFTDDECENGALFEVENNTFLRGEIKGVPSFFEVKGYKLICEECYSNELFR